MERHTDGDLLGADTPAQVQIYRQIRAEIVDGVWFDHTDFPGERELAARFGVSVITSRAALDRLAREGLVERQRGRGTRATHRPAPARGGVAPRMFPPGGPSGFTYRVVRAGVDTAPAEACDAFGVPFGTPMWQAVRLGMVGDVVHTVFHNVQPVEVGARHTAEDLATKPMVAILAGEGRPLRRITRRVAATRATPDAARHLDLDLDAPVLLVVLRADDEQGETVEWTRIFSRPDQVLREEVLDLARGVWATAEE